MKVTMSIDVQNCEQCPYHKSKKVYTADSFEDVREVYCSELKRTVHKYLDWNETAKIPEDCPYKNKL